MKKMNYKAGTKVFIICSVRDADFFYRNRLESYAAWLRDTFECIVHLPHIHTNQKAGSLEICTENKNAIKEADEVHIFYSSKSQGTHFDMGVAFALGKKIRVISNEEIKEGKSFPKMLTEWQLSD